MDVWLKMRCPVVHSSGDECQLTFNHDGPHEHSLQWAMKHPEVEGIEDDCKLVFPGGSK